MLSKQTLLLLALLSTMGVAWGGEIILSPSKTDSDLSAPKAREQRQRAGNYRKDQPATGANIILVPEDVQEEDGMLSPRGGVESKATENRLRAKSLRNSEEDHGAPMMVIPGSGEDGDSAQDRARSSRLRARAYREHGQAATDKVGPDGIPLVLCTNAESVAGRIGDDVQSGSLIFIIRDGKSIKARCR